MIRDKPCVSGRPGPVCHFQELELLQRQRATKLTDLNFRKITLAAGVKDTLKGASLLGGRQTN